MRFRLRSYSVSLGLTQSLSKKDLSILSKGCQDWVQRVFVCRMWMDERTFPFAVEQHTKLVSELGWAGSLITGRRSYQLCEIISVFKSAEST